MGRDYSYKNAPHDTKAKYTQPRVNFHRADDNGKITLHETTEDDQAGANGNKKKRDSTWEKVQDPDIEWLRQVTKGKRQNGKPMLMAMYATRQNGD